VASYREPAPRQQSFVLRYRLASWLCLLGSLAFGIPAAAVAAPDPDRILLGFLGVFIGLFAWSGFRTTYEVRPDRLIVRGMFFRRTVILSELAAAGAVRRRVSGNRMKPWDLVLSDRRGTVVRMNFDGSSPGSRRRLLTAIEQYVMAPGVQRAGQVENAMAGLLWWPTGVPSPARSRPLGVPGQHKRR
jgi:hypothetical protein